MNTVKELTQAEEMEKLIGMLEGSKHWIESMNGLELEDPELAEKYDIHIKNAVKAIKEAEIYEKSLGKNGYAFPDALYNTFLLCILPAGINKTSEYALSCLNGDRRCIKNAGKSLETARYLSNIAKGKHVVMPEYTQIILEKTEKYFKDASDADMQIRASIICSDKF
ncbi:MAG: hypothetical protein NT129_01805 [Candidatus Aenigmarchaeota archaeon]|nr:hypothetical protein [Candidatus Aenigmarchaeota archaeon]